MHGYGSLGMPRAAGNTASAPSSPRCRHGRSKRGPKQQSIPERTVFFIMSVVFRRRGVLLSAPLLYISGMLLYMGTVSFDVVSLKNVVIISKPSPAGSVYRSPQVFQKLWPYMQDDSNHTHNLLMTVWNSKVHKSYQSQMVYS